MTIVYVYSVISYISLMIIRFKMIVWTIMIKDHCPSCHILFLSLFIRFKMIVWTILTLPTAS